MGKDVSGAKREGGKEREKSAKAEKGKGAPAVRAIVFVFSELPSLPNAPPFFPSSLSPTHFSACHVG